MILISGSLGQMHLYITIFQQKLTQTWMPICSLNRILGQIKYFEILESPQSSEQGLWICNLTFLQVNGH